MLAGLLLGGCGNYSNDDLDFQLALPESSDMEAQMQLSVVRLNSAEYYKATRSAITTFNGMVESLVGLIDLVRGITPTSRNGDERIWGPWPADKVPGWEMRVVMQRSTVSPSVLHMDYWVQVRPVGTGRFGLGVVSHRAVHLGWVGARPGRARSTCSPTTRAPLAIPSMPIAGLANLDYLDRHLRQRGLPDSRDHGHRQPAHGHDAIGPLRVLPEPGWLRTDELRLARLDRHRRPGVREDAIRMDRLGRRPRRSDGGARRPTQPTS